ncbi:MAG: alanine dehydrogenase [Acidobacteria bacterium]|nr:alanine dehydrogenase [Acidobacteriota bacterium]
MLIGAPKEVKDHETRVGLVPAGVKTLRQAGHEVVVEAAAGEGSSIPDEEYRAAGAVVVDSAADVWGQADIVVKVKEPQPSEYPGLRPGLTLFTYLHLAPLRELTQRLLDTRTTAIAYETVQRDDGALPLLEPMSEVAGRLAPQEGAEYLESAHGGRGVLLGGVPGVPPAEVVIVGAGTVGSNAAKVAIGTGAHVTILDLNIERLRRLDDLYSGKITTLVSNPGVLEEACLKADLLIGAVLVAGKSAPKIITRDIVRRMRKGSVFVDVAIDQGGCSETSKPTTHSDPVFTVDGVIHYCVTNMPALAPRTSTFALTNATLPYLQKLANLGVEEALHADPALMRGLNTYAGSIAHAAVAESQQRAFHPLNL